MYDRKGTVGICNQFAFNAQMLKTQLPGICEGHDTLTKLPSGSDIWRNSRYILFSSASVECIHFVF